MSLLVIKTVKVQKIDHKATGEKAKALLAKSGLSLREVSRRMGISVTFLCDLTYGRRNWRYETEYSFLSALHAKLKEPKP